MKSNAMEKPGPEPIEPTPDKFVSETTKRSYDVHLDEEGWVITKKEDGKIMKLKPEEWERFRDRNKLSLLPEEKVPEKDPSKKRGRYEGYVKHAPKENREVVTNLGKKGRSYPSEDSEQDRSATIQEGLTDKEQPDWYKKMLKEQMSPKNKKRGGPTKESTPTETKAEKKIWNVPNVGDIITSRRGISRRVFAVDQNKELIGLEQTDTGDKTQMTFADYEKAKENIHNIQGRKKFDEKYNASRQELSQPEMTLALESGQSIWTPSREEVKIVEVVKKPQTTDESLKNGYAVLEFQPKQNSDGTWRNEKVKREVIPFHKLLWAAEQGTLNLENPAVEKRKEELEKAAQLKEELKAPKKELPQETGVEPEEVPPEIVGYRNGKPVLEGDFKPIKPTDKTSWFRKWFK